MSDVRWNAKVTDFVLLHLPSAICHLLPQQSLADHCQDASGDLLLGAGERTGDVARTIQHLHAVVGGVHRLGTVEHDQVAALLLQLGERGSADPPSPARSPPATGRAASPRPAWPSRRAFRSDAVPAARRSWRSSAGSHLHWAIVAGGGRADHAVAEGELAPAGIQQFLGRYHRHHPRRRRISHATGPLRSTTSCPAASAASASARPIRPLEAFVR